MGVAPPNGEGFNYLKKLGKIPLIFDFHSKGGVLGSIYRFSMPDMPARKLKIISKGRPLLF